MTNVINNKDYWHQKEYVNTLWQNLLPLLGRTFGDSKFIFLALYTEINYTLHNVPNKLISLNFIK